MFNDFFNEKEIIDFLNVFINPNNSYANLYKKVIFDKSLVVFAQIDLLVFKIAGYRFDNDGGSFPTLIEIHNSVIDNLTIIGFYNNLYKRYILLQ